MYKYILEHFIFKSLHCVPVQTGQYWKVLKIPTATKSIRAQKPSSMDHQKSKTTKSMLGVFVYESKLVPNRMLAP